MPGRERGFTIIELLIVVTVIVVIASIAIPSLIAARLTANETAAIETLRSICTAQAQFQRSGKADEDLDGAGEHGSLGELSGSAGVRGGTAKVPTDLTASMRGVSENGEIGKSGYYFRVYLPDAAGHGVRDEPGGGVGAGVVDPDYAEQVWCCYAWPTRHGVSGRRTFFVNQVGDILFTDSPSYEGADCGGIRAGNAFLGSDPDTVMGRTAIGTAGQDGLVWRAAN